MITIVDDGAGPLIPLEGTLDRLGYAHRRASRPEEAADTGPLVLPSEGAFETARKALFERGWWNMIPYLTSRQSRPVLGIGLGMHLLAEGSEEAPKSDGLGLLPGIVRRLGPGVKIPHAGWAEAIRQGDPPAMPAMEDLWLYFFHTHALEARAGTALVARHGRAFAAADVHGQVIGFQARPERSGLKGEQLLGAALQWLGESPEPCTNA